MKYALAAVVRIVLFLLVFVSWMWVLVQPFSNTLSLLLIVGAPLLVFPVSWLGRLLLDRDPTPPSAEWLTTFIHAVVMVLFGAAVIRAASTYDAWRLWQIPVPVEIGLLLAILTGTAAALAVLNLALRGWGAPFGIALSRRLAVDWLYAWTRNPMVLATLAFAVALGIWLQAAGLVLWVCLLITPALLFFVKMFEERELEIRFGAGYLQYKASTPMLIPRRPAAPVKASTARSVRPKARVKRKAAARAARRRK